MRGSLVRVAAVLLLAAFAMASSDFARVSSRAPDLHGTRTTYPVENPRAGYYAFLDPETGEFTDAGDPGAVPLSDDLLGRIDTSDQGLVEEDSPASGVMVRLNGRFSGLTVLAKDEHGAVTTKCLSGLPVDARGVRR